MNNGKQKEYNPVESMQFWQGATITKLEENEIFLYGSNPQGINGAGAAKAAMSLSKGAKHGVGRGFNGSNAYALVTKSLNAGFLEKSTGILYDKEGYCSVSPEQIRTNIDELYEIAKSPEHKDKKFLVSYQYEYWPNGSPKKSLNGYTSQEMLEMFAKDKEVPPNIVFHESYKPHLETLYNNKHKNEQFAGKATVSNDDKSLKKKFIEPKTPILNSVDDYDYFWGLECYQSNFHPAKFNFKNKQFISSEQFFMYCKAMFFKRPEIAEEILNVNVNYKLARDFLNGEITRNDIINNDSRLRDWKSLQMSLKNFGRRIDNYDETLWSENRYKFMREGVLQKFLQNSDLMELMKSSGNKFFVEASPYDEIWGIKLNEEIARKLGPLNWKGKNLLGCMLTEVKLQLMNDLSLEQNREEKPTNKNMDVHSNSQIEVLNFYSINKVIPEDGVYIGRINYQHNLPQSIFANPYVVKTPEERGTTIDKYRQWLWNQILEGTITKEDIKKLENKKLVCYCAPKPCHGNVVKAVVEYLMNNEDEFDKKVEEGRLKRNINLDSKKSKAFSPRRP